jgi:hypothetical protein
MYMIHMSVKIEIGTKLYNACKNRKLMTPQFSPELGALNIKDQTGRSVNKEVGPNK